MTHLTERYPDAPQGAQARSILSLIEERRARTRPRLADTTAADTTAADTTAADTAATDTAALGDAAPADAARRPDPSAADTGGTATDAPRDTLARADRRAADNESMLPAPPGDQAAQQKSDTTAAQRVDPEKGGWTLLVQTFSGSREASVRVADVGRRLGGRWPVTLLREETGETTQYRLVVGQFRSERAAERAREKLADQLTRRPQVWALSNLGARP
jgi:hypothetical protein